MSPTVAIKLLGLLPTPDEIRAAIETLETCASVRPQAAEAYAPAIEELKAVLKDAELASDSLLLASRGERDALRIEFDRETKEGKLRQVGKTGRPTAWYNEVIANKAEAIAERLKQETGKPAKPRQVCEQVAHVAFLRSLVPPELLDASPNGNIYHAWKNRVKKRRKIVREIDQHAPSEEDVKQLIRHVGLPIAPGAWRSTPWLYYLEVLLELAESEAAGDGPAEP